MYRRKCIKCGVGYEAMYGAADHLCPICDIFFEVYAHLPYVRNRYSTWFRNESVRHWQKILKNVFRGKTVLFLK